MPWRCPACHSAIRHSDVEAKPRRGERYRCHICRLELTLDPETDKLAVTPLESAQQPEQVRREIRERLSDGAAD